MSSKSKETVLKVAENTSLHDKSTLRALVVDDDHIAMTIVSEMLLALGMQVESAEGGVEAMRCLNGSAYDLVITDLQMPDIDGYMLTRWLKNQSRQTAVIVMTGRNRYEVERYMESGLVDHWIFKPFSLRDLKGVLGDLASHGLLSNPAND